jgi:hypothetical protein
VQALADRAQSLAGPGAGETDLRLAGHLAELAWLAAPDDPGIARVRVLVNLARVQASTSTMARGVFGWAARESAGDST